MKHANRGNDAAKTNPIPEPPELREAGYWLATSALFGVIMIVCVTILTLI